MAQDRRPIRVLVVDDSQVYREALTEVVEATPDFKVIATASSGLEALDLMVLGATPELVLVDMQMPQMDGLETARRIGRLSREVVVVLLSAHQRGPTFEKGSLAVQYKGDVTSEWLAGLWERRTQSG